MVRPSGKRDLPAISNIRVSPSTKEALLNLMKDNGSKTYDECLRFLLSQYQPQSQPKPQLTKQPVITRDMLQRSDVNNLFKSVSKDVYQNYVNKPDKAKARPTITRTRKNKSW